MAADRVAALKGRLTEWLDQQSWYGEIKGKWDELDPQSQLIVNLVGVAIAAVVVLAIGLSQVFSAGNLREEYNDKAELLQLIQNSSDELRALRVSGAEGVGSTEPWTPYLQGLAGQGSGISGEALQVKEEEAPKAKPARPARGGTASAEPASQAVETLLTVQVAQVNLRQLTRLVHAIETGRRPVKLRALSVDAKEDLSGYLSATLSLSGFSIPPSGEE